MKIIVAIIVYNRFDNLKRWIECWQQCNTEGADLIVIHTGNEVEKYQAVCAGVAKYINRINRGLDIGAFQDVCKERLDGFPNDWDYLLWITDDVMPMSKDFITPFIDQMKDDVGITCMQISTTTKPPHVRTVAHCMAKEISKRIKFPADPVMNKQQGFWFEFKGGDNTLGMQIRKMGLKCVQVAPTASSPLWDTGYGKRLERMQEHLAVFPESNPADAIHHFYHIYAAGKWQQSVAEHVLALKMGLYGRLHSLNIGLIGNQNKREAVKQYFIDQGLNFNVIAEKDEGWEQETQIPMWEFCQHNDGIVFYAHSKGSYNDSEVNTRWRRSMTYWNVIRYTDAIDRLKEKECDTYGCHWIYPVISMPEHKLGNPMYAGTFWWAKCDLVRTFMRPPLTHRHEAEGWIGYKYIEKPWRLWDCTPYFPNSRAFADEWISNPNFIPEENGISL